MVLSFLLIVYPLVQWLLNWNDIPEELLQEELKHMQNGDPADIVYLCFQEAFNKVSYQVFFFKETKQVRDKKEGHGMEMCLKDRTNWATVND